MIIQTRYENSKCSICKTPIPMGADCEWTSGTPGVRCVKPCTPPAKKPRKVSGRVIPISPVENASGSTPTQARGIPEADLLVRKPCPEAGIQAFRETLATFDLPSLSILASIAQDAITDCLNEAAKEASRLHTPGSNLQPARSPENAARALPAPGQVTDVPKPDPYHVECQRCGHIWDCKGFPEKCNYCDSRELERDKLGTIFNPIESHSCRLWAFHDPDNAAHTKNCTKCQLEPRACTKPVTPQVKPAYKTGVYTGVSVAKPKPKFSF